MAARLDAPQLFTSAAFAARQPDVRKHLQVLGDGLARQVGADSQPRDRLRTVLAQPCDQREPRLIRERGKHRRDARVLAGEW